MLIQIKNELTSLIYGCPMLREVCIRSYQTPGTLNLEYIRFLWLHRHLDSGRKLDLNFDEFNSVLATMESLLVLYRVTGTSPAFFVVPSRLPEYGDERVLATWH